MLTLSWVAAVAMIGGTFGLDFAGVPGAVAGGAFGAITAWFFRATREIG